MQVHSVEAIIQALSNADVQYLVVGGLAVNAHGYKRLTDDVDLVIGLEPSNIVNGLRALSSIGYQMSIPVTPEDFADAEKREGWRRNKNMIVLKLWSDAHRRTPIDVFVYEPFDFQAAYKAARWLPMGGRLHAPIVSLETLLAMKESAGRPQDLADISELKRVQELRGKKDQ